jgi:hypothetical protein
VPEVVRAAKTSAADAVLLSCVSLGEAESVSFVAELDAALPAHTAVVVGGHSAQSIPNLPRGVVRVADLAEFESWLSGRVSPTTGRRAGRGR